jgi:hypothetical protein
MIKKPPPKGKIITGTIILVVGFLSPLLIPAVVATNWPTGVKSVVSGLLAFGIPEIFMIIAVSIMGKDGFNYLKRILSILLRKYGPPDEVSKTRYRIGLFMFILPLLVSIFAPYFGPKLEFFENSRVTIMIVLHVMLIVSIFVLGGDFWDKLQGLFTHGAKIQPASKDAPNKHK